MAYGSASGRCGSSQEPVSVSDSMGSRPERPNIQEELTVAYRNLAVAFRRLLYPSVPFRVGKIVMSF